MVHLFLSFCCNISRESLELWANIICLSIFCTVAPCFCDTHRLLSVRRTWSRSMSSMFVQYCQTVRRKRWKWRTKKFEGEFSRKLQGRIIRNQCACLVNAEPNLFWFLFGRGKGHISAHAAVDYVHKQQTVYTSVIRARRYIGLAAERYAPSVVYCSGYITGIRLPFDRLSTAYRRSLRSQWRNQLKSKSNGYFRSECAIFLPTFFENRLSSFCVILLTNRLTQ